MNVRATNLTTLNFRFPDLQMASYVHDAFLTVQHRAKSFTLSLTAHLMDVNHLIELPDIHNLLLAIWPADGDILHLTDRAESETDRKFHLRLIAASRHDGSLQNGSIRK